MEKQLNKVKILKRLSIILFLAICIGMFLIYYFTNCRMGMERHMVYLNYKWENKFPLQTILFIFVGFLLFSLTCIFLNLRRKPRDFKYGLGVLFINILSLIYVIIGSISRETEYYVIILFLIFLTIQMNGLYFIINRLNKKLVS